MYKCLLYLLQDIISRNNLLFNSKYVEHNEEELNIEVDNLDYLINFETGTYIRYILRIKIIHSILLNMPFIGLASK